METGGRLNRKKERKISWDMNNSVVIAGGKWETVWGINGDKRRLDLGW